MLVGSLLVYLFRTSKNLQGVKEGYAIVTFGWLGLTFVGAIPMLFWFISQDPYGWSNLFLHFTNSFFIGVGCLRPHRLCIPPKASRTPDGSWHLSTGAMGRSFFVLPDLIVSRSLGPWRNTLHFLRQ